MDPTSVTKRPRRIGGASSLDLACAATSEALGSDVAPTHHEPEDETAKRSPHH